MKVSLISMLILAIIFSRLMFKLNNSEIFLNDPFPNGRKNHKIYPNLEIKINQKRANLPREFMTKK